MGDSLDVTLTARDGYALAGTIFEPAAPHDAIVVVNAATGVPRGFYRRFATHVAASGLACLTWDYRGIGGSRPDSLRGFDARASDWGLLDMPAVVDWAAERPGVRRVYLVGHSIGGQVAGMIDNPERVAAMATFSAQSGHWRLQGGEQKWVVWAHVHVTMPLLALILGYLPMRLFAGGEDLPRGVALQWSRWCRDRDYLLGDDALPLERYDDFQAPVLALSFDDDKWGTPQAVDAMMRAYPRVERRHVTPSDLGVQRIGHMGAFRPEAQRLWDDVLTWLAAVP